MTEHPLAPPLDPSRVASLPEQHPGFQDGGEGLGRAVVEATQEPSALRKAAQAFANNVEEVISDENSIRAQKRERIKDLLAQSTLEEEVAKDSQDSDDLSYLLGVSSRVADETGLQIAQTLLEVSKTENMQELYHRDDPSLQVVLGQLIEFASTRTNEAADEIFVRIAGLVERAAGTKFGRMITWMQDGEPRKDLPQNIASLVRSEHFGLACAYSEYDHISRESAGNITENRSKLRDAEQKILEMLDITPEMAREFRSSLRYRTPPERMEFDEGGFDEDMGIHEAEWINGVGRYYRNIGLLGSPQAKFLHDVCGIVNFDRYDPEQLKQQVELLKRLSDKQLAAEQLEEDFTLVLADALGDWTGVFGSTLRHFSKNTLVFEIKRPNDILRAFGLLKAMNIQPSTLVMGTHGAEGQLEYNQEKESFKLSTDPFDKQALHVKHFDFGYLFRTYMKPGKKTGERVVIMYACNAATRGVGVPSMAEGIVRQTKRKDRVVVKAAAEGVRLRRPVGASGPIFYNPEAVRKPGLIQRGMSYMRRRPEGRAETQTAPKGRPAQTWEFRRGRTSLRSVRITKPKKGTPLI